MTSPEDRRRWEAAHREQRNRQKNVAKQRHKHERNDRDRELRFRFGRLKNSSVWHQLGLFIGTRNDLENSQFIFINAGKRQYIDTMHDRLPVW